MSLWEAFHVTTVVNQIVTGETEEKESKEFFSLLEYKCKFTKKKFL
jgi:hypothetical protein